MSSKTLLHAAAGTTALALISLFWVSTIVTELSGQPQLIATAKTGIVWMLPVLIAAIATAGITGFRLGGKSKAPVIVAKRRRMPFIALNGVLVLVPSAIFLYLKAAAGQFDTWFYGVQVLELVAGATNIWLLGLNFRAGRSMTGGRRRMRAKAT